MAFKTLLLWLLAFAIPAQGFAASAMLFCSASHQRVQVQFTAQDGAAHRHAEHTSHVHAAAVADDASLQGPATDPASAAADTASSQCSVCADCCHQVVIAAAPVLRDAAAPSPVYTSGAFAPATDAIPGALERPPRLIFA